VVWFSIPLSQLVLLQGPLGVQRRSPVGPKTHAASAAVALPPVCWCSLAPLPVASEPAGFRRALVWREGFLHVTLQWTSLVLPLVFREILHIPRKPEVWLAREGQRSLRADQSHPAPRGSPPCCAGALAALAPAPAPGSETCWGYKPRTRALCTRGRVVALSTRTNKINGSVWREGKAGFARESRAQAWLPRGVVPGDGAGPASAGKRGPGSARLSRENSGASHGAGERPDRSQLCPGPGGERLLRSCPAPAPLPPMHSSVRAGCVNTEYKCLTMFSLETKGKSDGCRIQMRAAHHGLSFLWRRTEQVIFTLCAACPDYQYLEASTQKRSNLHLNYVKTLLSLNLLMVIGEKNHISITIALNDQRWWKLKV